MILSSRSDECGLVHKRRDETRETREGSRSEVPDFQSFEPRTSDRAFLSYLVRPALRSAAAGRPFHFPANVPIHIAQRPGDAGC